MAAQAAPNRGVSTYYASKQDSLEVTLRDKEQNLRRLQAQRNELNAKGEAKGGRCVCGVYGAAFSGRCGGVLAWVWV